MVKAKASRERRQSAILVGIVMGSESDRIAVTPAAVVLEDLGIGHEILVRSAHRTPDAVRSYARSAERRGLRILIAGAGGAAHLAGALAAHSLLPVIGIPLASSELAGLDSLLSTVQMPAGVPVATVAIGASGAKNAAHLAAQILALGDPVLASKLRRRRTALRTRISRGAGVRSHAG